MSPTIPPWARVLVGLVATIGLVLIGLVAQSDRRQGVGMAIVLAVSGPVIAWITLWRFTSAAPVMETWDAHVRFFVLGVGLLLVGLVAVLGVGEGGATALRWLLGVPLLLLGGLVLEAERRDFRRWRAAVRNPPRRDWRER